MNVSDFLHILQKSETILSPKQTRQLEEMLVEYPYFQAARALYLKGLKNLESYKYNNELKLTAAYTTDREVLFDFVTSREFDQNKIANKIIGRTLKLAEIDTKAEEVEPNPDAQTFLGTSEEDPLPQNQDQAENILHPQLFESKPEAQSDSNTIAAESEAKEELGIGKPLTFTKKEKHSFSAWLQLASQKNIREETVENETEDLTLEKKYELLDKFIENNPKIVPKEQPDAKIDIRESTKIDKNELMTETLAKVYLEQKKYKKAIQAFKILSLKYPEKSGFFADQIQAVKKLHKEKD